MGQPNTQRIEHLIGQFPNSFRDTDLFQIINDIDEERIGHGYSEVIRQDPPLSAYVAKVITWDAPAKNKKRVETTFTRSGGPLVTSITSEVFNENGTGIVATITATITRTGNKQVAYTNVSIVRN